jgi:hypothetical protein
MVSNSVFMVQMYKYAIRGLVTQVTIFPLWQGSIEQVIEQLVAKRLHGFAC